MNRTKFFQISLLSLFCFGAISCTRLVQEISPIVEPSDTVIIEQPKYITGLVRDIRNQPAVNVEVTLFSFQEENTIHAASTIEVTRTDETGRFMIKSIPTGNFNLLISKSDNEKLLLRNLSISETDPELFLGDLSLKATGALSGTAMLKRHYDHAGIQATISGLSFKGTSDSNGAYKVLFIPPGNYDVVISKYGFVSRTINNVEVNAYKMTNLEHRYLERQTILGTVTGNIELEGQSDFSNVLISVVNTNYSATTNAQGDYKLQIPIGHYNGISFTRNDFRRVALTDVFQVREDSIYSPPNQKLIAVANTLTGTVSLKGQSDHSNIEIKVVGKSFQTTTNYTGVFELKHIPLGVHSIEASAANCPSVVISNILVEAGKPIQIPDIVLEPLGQIKGQVTLKGQFLHAGITVTLENSTFETKTESDGAFSFLRAPIGSYQIRAQYLGYTTSLSDPIQVVIGNASQVPSMVLQDASDVVYANWQVFPEDLTEDYQGEFRVQVEVTDAGSGVKNNTQKLQYALGNQQSFNSISMQPANSENTWYAIITDQNWNTWSGQNIRFRVSASDKAGNTKISAIQTELIDDVNDIPFVKITSFFQTWHKGNIDISAEAIDSDGSIQKVAFYYSQDRKNWIFIQEDHQAPFYVDWNTNSVFSEADTIYIKAIAFDNDGATDKAVSPKFGIDNLIPESSGTNDNDWHRSNFAITLQAEDSGSGVEKTKMYYRINGGQILNVGTHGFPFFSSDGSHTLTFWAEDQVGNVGPIQTLSNILLDTTCEISIFTEDTNGKIVGQSEHPSRIIHFSLNPGEANGQAEVLIGSHLSGIRLYDDGSSGDAVANDGVYECDYQVPLNIDLTKVNAYGLFKDVAGNEAIKMLFQAISIDTTQ